MKKLILILILFLSVNSFAQNGKNDKNTREWKYEIECAGVGQDGSYLVRVFSFEKTRKLVIEQAKKNAVHGVIFKGFIGNSECGTQKPLAKNPNAEAENEHFFNNFFMDGGKYMKYVTLSTDGNVDPKDIVKVGKEYKLGIIVTVSKDLLRKDLEAAGIIKSFSSMF
ncbi:hypothetical protein [Chryseobacterium koreense]|uniref:Uncharacterized protein n=1 Tax=Chryseobacterium koreense CCUG 49689 TaxID=1304281 RepID=A0A0J7IXJ0_9FLAO|nr:hypothetical protein [Chryseobacterium koreense]KMQ70687.1 hypothetical protein ACM44_11035 [Chryseobacterium koreense CCUG 49689]MBB5334537.1 hypothetical protein [Chryseobacterium koreense]